MEPAKEQDTPAKAAFGFYRELSARSLACQHTDCGQPSSVEAHVCRQQLLPRNPVPAVSLASTRSICALFQTVGLFLLDIVAPP